MMQTSDKNTRERHSGDGNNNTRSLRHCYVTRAPDCDGDCKDETCAFLPPPDTKVRGCDV